MLITFCEQAMENSVVFEMSARKFLSTVKKYSRPSLTELADDYMHRFGLAPRMRKRSGSCPDLWALHQKGSDRKGRLGIIRAGAHLPPVSSRVACNNHWYLISLHGGITPGPAFS